MLLASVDHVKKTDAAHKEGAWGLACGVVTATIVLGMLLVSEKLEQKIAQALALLLLCMWSCAAGVLTFKAPFVKTGNGYFASWVGLLCTLMLAALELGLSV